MRLPENLRPDCERCLGLCCAALPFARSADFAFDKMAGAPCPHLTAECRCGIHAELRERGMKGCTVYECFGAGQKLTQVTYKGRSWQDHPEQREEMFAVFTVLQQLHEMLALLTEAGWRAEGLLAEEAAAERERLALLAELAPAELLALAIGPLRVQVGGLLRRVSAEVRARAGAGREMSGPPHRRSGAAAARGAAGGKRPGGGGSAAGRDRIGAKLRGADMAGADLRGTLLIAADLRGANLRSADLLGADLRDADLRGADLRGALFLTQPQLNAARGDGAVRLPEHLRRPDHWPLA
ncbi:pentapeptide repeat-containing protein [Paenibacillus glufosinatiresistens]|uniref:pentapeptide repeat-containing protein n=1 Tax=Paenibacillus glufosinatiresistens TaxID=3070657 RepID=UPI00286E19DB|nr:pentapeptide repeat-containing protein [Paenibacillus sp. YX.27]